METLMLIDDDPGIRRMLGLLIREHSLGRVVCELESGEHAVEELLFYRPDVVLIDLLLPVVDGVRIVSQARERGFSGKFIMISQVTDRALISSSYESGIEFFINKPINRIEAVSVIRNVCTSARLERSLGVIQSAVKGFPAVSPAPAARPQNTELEAKIRSMFTEIGILGVSGSEELLWLLRRISKGPKTDLDALYRELLEEKNGSCDEASLRALRQRVRRLAQRALSTVAELGSEDYANAVFTEYGSLLFDFREVRQQMRCIKDPREIPGRINTKKFIFGLASRL